MIDLAPLRRLARLPLFRLLGVNLVAGVVVATLAVGGLLAFDPFGLRALIVADQSPAVALLLLGGGFVITFAGVVMASAIKQIGRE